MELAGFVRPDNQNLDHRKGCRIFGPVSTVLTVLALKARPQQMTRFRHAPRTLADLAAELEPLRHPAD